MHPKPLTKAQHRSLMIGLSIGIPGLTFVLFIIAILVMRFIEWKGESEERHMKHKNSGGGDFHSPFHKKKQLKEETVNDHENKITAAEEGRIQQEAPQGKKKKK